MGLCRCIQPEAVQSKTIDKSLKKAHNIQTDEVKLLLLGAGDAGKSTIFKQMKIIHQEGYSEEEKAKHRNVVWGFVLACVQAIVDGAQELKISLEEHADFGIHIKEMSAAEPLTPDIGRQMGAMWNSQPVREIVERAAQFQFLDNTAYFLNDIERITGVGYIPTEQDILRTRVRTTGIVEAQWQFKNVTFKMFDVGGQRNERRKWIHCFDSVTAVIFVAAISEYDQTLYEDVLQNRMTEALALFEQISNSRWFLETSIILFLNKMDLFEEKLKTKSLTDVFPDYVPVEDPKENVKAASSFVSRKFRERCKNVDRDIYTHYTCATNTESVRFVFTAVRDIVLQNNLKTLGF